MEECISSVVNIGLSLWNEVALSRVLYVNAQVVFWNVAVASSWRLGDVDQGISCQVVTLTSVSTLIEQWGFVPKYVPMSSGLSG